jgi:two-component system cell cycle response regulator
MSSALPRLTRRHPPALAAAGDLAPLDRRLGLLQLLRVGLAVAAAVTAFAFPDALDHRGPFVAALGAAYAAVSGGAELARRRLGLRSTSIVGGMLILDGVYLAGAMVFTGGPQSPLAFLVLVHVVAVTLLLSLRTGLKAALWHALLLFLSSWLQQAGLVGEGPGLSQEQAAVLGALALLAVAVAAAGFSSLNEGELRRGKAELRALAAMAARLAATHATEELAGALLDGVDEAFGSPRAAVVVREGRAGPGRAFVRGPAGGAEEAGADGGRPGAPQERVPARASTLAGRHDPLLAAALPGAFNVVVVPLVVEDITVGTLAVERGGGAGARVTARTVDLLSQFGAHAALALRAAALRAEVERLASTDALTGLANRRAFQESLAHELAVAARRGEPCGLVVLDVDHFKVVNDTHGHQAGDEVLRLVGRALADEARETDLAARYGGEEFAVVVPGCSTAEAAAVAERLRAAVIATCATGPMPVTVSAGVASYPGDAIDGDALVAAADAGLYRAKRLGRNRTVRFRRPRPERAGRGRLRAVA